MKVQVIGGQWLKKPMGFEKSMCFANCWSYVPDGLYHNVIMRDMKVNVMKVDKGLSLDLKVMANILLDCSHHDVHYLIIKPNNTNTGIEGICFFRVAAFCNDIGMTEEVALSVINNHSPVTVSLSGAFEAAIQQFK